VFFISVYVRIVLELYLKTSEVKPEQVLE